MSEKFEKLVKEACKVECQYQELSSKTKLTCEAIVSGCLQRAGSTPEKLAQLEETIEARRKFMPHVFGFMTHLTRWFESGRVTGGIPDSVGRMALPGRDAAIAELSAVHGSLYELWAIVAQRVQAKHPEVFGKIEDLGAHHEQFEALKQKRHVLLQRLAKEFQADDLHIGNLQRNGTASVSFKHGQIPLAPTESAGQRLITHLLQTDPQNWGRRAGN